MKLKTRLLIFNCLPLVAFAAASIFLGITQFRDALYEEKEGYLRSAAVAAMTLYASQGYGDYQRRPDGRIWRGMNFNVTERRSLVDDLKEETGVDITFFFGDRAAVTSIRGDDGIRQTGLQADEAIRTYSLEQGSPIWCRHIVIDGKNCQAYVVPIRQPSDNSVVGAMMASQPAEGFESTIRHYVLTTMFVMLMVLITVFLFVRWHVEWFARKYAEIADRSRQDLLTGLYNKLTFEGEAVSYLAKKDPDAVAVLLILDFDDFKRVNDLYGHQVGDSALRAFAEILIRCFRADDIIGRVGGDEFMVLMPDMMPGNVRRADEIARDILARLRELRLGEATGFSCSIGIGTGTGPCGFQTLYELADKALYEAKARGKACFVRLSAATDTAGTEERI